VARLLSGVAATVRYAVVQAEKSHVGLVFLVEGFRVKTWQEIQGTANDP
jgi:hypothetical protein